MTQKPCSFCGHPETATNYRPQPETAYICSRCVITLTAADQLQLIKGHALAIQKGYVHKAWALSKFIVKQNDGHGKRKQLSARKKRRLPIRQPVKRFRKKHLHRNPAV
jgi:hypothetical protein